MFLGSVSQPRLDQILRTVDFKSWGSVYVCCSGSFRVDRAIKTKWPTVRLISNDVSLYSVALGRLLMNQPFPILFTGRLAFIEKMVEEKDFENRVAALMVGHEMATYKGKNEWAKSHFQHYVDSFTSHLSKAREKLVIYSSKTKIDGFEACDFRAHAEAARENNGGVVAFPPTYKKGYERIYKFVDDNTEWSRPDYEVWDPDDLDDWVKGLRSRHVPYCVFADRKLDGLKPITAYLADGRRAVYSYSNSTRSSILSTTHRSEPFQYEPLDLDQLTAQSVVSLVRTDSAKLNFLKDRYLAKGISHVPGDMNFLVYLDGTLAGAFIYAREKFGAGNRVYLLSDFSTSRERRLSKLIALLSTARLPVSVFETRSLMRVLTVATTAFTDKPVSMKYRGVFKLASRKPGMLNYHSHVRSEDPQTLYRLWFGKWAKYKNRQQATS